MKYLFAVCAALLALGVNSSAGADETPAMGILFQEEWNTHWAMKGLAEALATNGELSAHPDVDAEKLRASFQPLQETFHQSLLAAFAPAMSGELGTPDNYEAKFMVKYDAWRAALDEYIDYIQTLPSTVNIQVDDGKARYKNTPDLPGLYADVPFQTVVFIVEGESSDATPRFREETVDLSLYKTIPITTSDTGTEIIRLNVAELPEGAHSVPIRIADAEGNILTELPLNFTGQTSGTLAVRIVEEETGEITSARVGIYGENGFFRAANAIPLFVHEDEEYERSLGDPLWPSEDKRVFYSSGEFDMGLPPGEYRILIRKGVERLLHDETVTIAAGEQLDLTVPMKRWIDMPEKGWYSGDDHVHIRRNGENNAPIMQWVRAEDIHVSNVVQMDDIDRLYFLQYAWGDRGMYVADDYILRSGQEGPRTSVRGHALFFNLTHAIHDHDTYYDYENVFDTAHRMGGLGGYAHFGSGFFAEGGMSIGVPLEKVDFVEVLQGYNLDTDVLHHFWNMGYRMAPTAGSDFPYTPTAGDALMYVYAPGDFSYDNWYSGLKAGHTFVTDGPMLEFTVNGEVPGSEIALDAPGRVKVRAWAQVNPSLDRLQRLEILQFGEMIQTVEAAGDAEGPLEIEFELEVAESSWIAARVIGEKSKAHSAAVFIVLDGAPTWDAARLGEEIDRAEEKLGVLEQALANPGPDAVLGANASKLNHYIKAARDKYETLRESAGSTED